MLVSQLILLFCSAFFAATIFPAQSELILVGLSLSEEYSKILLVIIASVGNILGAIVNYILGFYLIKFKDKKWFPLKGRALEKYGKIYQKWGVWSLLFAWLPIIGDPLTVVAGIFRSNIWLFLLLVSIGKIARYLFLVQIF